LYVSAVIWPEFGSDLLDGLSYGLGAVNIGLDDERFAVSNSSVTRVLVSVLREKRATANPCRAKDAPNPGPTPATIAVS
jgi:hypothetical protein